MEVLQVLSWGERGILLSHFGLYLFCTWQGREPLRSRKGILVPTVLLLSNLRQVTKPLWCWLSFSSLKWRSWVRKAFPMNYSSKKKKKEDIAKKDDLIAKKDRSLHKNASSLIIRGVQIKATMRHYYTPNRMAVITITTTIINNSQYQVLVRLQSQWSFHKSLTRMSNGG